MFIEILKKIFGSKNDRTIKKLSKIVLEINQLESTISKLSDQQIKNKTKEFKDRHQRGETLDQLLPEAFAVVRETAKRTLSMRHFDVQLIGGIVLHQGKITEMRTGEGKTLVATLPAYLNALTGKGVHIVTVNDYLVKRDAMWMKPIYDALDLTVGIITSENMSREDKVVAYKADITYGTNNEFGFDYLRDNMAFSTEELVQRELYYAIVDEVDSVLIDEARTPLIISGASQETIDLYMRINQLIKGLTKITDFTIDEKARQIILTEEGHEHIEQILSQANLLKDDQSLYDVSNINLMHHVHAALKAHYLFKRDVDYLIRDQEIIIIDEHTGRAMSGRRWSDGIHQAVEAKEGVPIQKESHTLASITFQNYFRLYDKLSGMTGTADTEAYELQHIYGLEVVVIPTNVPCKRQDLPDFIYLKSDEKYAAILADIEDCKQRGQPVLVGTSSIENSEFLSKLLSQKKIDHQVLNAKFHAQEAEIIAEAGRPEMVTIATNMAGRGTDIVLGGNLTAELAKLNYSDPEEVNNRKIAWQARHDQVISLGGLKVIGSERHESRRIDNQLRGRTGRQGDPGLTKFYLSLEDNLMRIFISDTISAILNKLGLEKGEAITHSLITKAVENAQKKVEGHNFEIRKQLLEFDDVANDQRTVVYQQRSELIATQDCSQTIQGIKHQEIEQIVAEFILPDSLLEEWDLSGLEAYLETELHHKVPINKWLEADNNLSAEEIKLQVIDFFDQSFAAKEQLIGTNNMRSLEKIIMLNTLDHHWKEHLATMDYLRQSIHLRGYAQKDPKQEYKREAFNLFTTMLNNIRRDVIKTLAGMNLQEVSDMQSLTQNFAPTNVEYIHPDLTSVGNSNLDDFDIQDNILNENNVISINNLKTSGINKNNNNQKIGRNDPCPCNSGKKYKHCHGKL
jgi:preprotein translocase subunit SecA